MAGPVKVQRITHVSAQGAHRNPSNSVAAGARGVDAAAARS